jgi:hypothetical protein
MEPSRQRLKGAGTVGVAFEIGNYLEFCVRFGNQVEPVLQY